MSKKTYLFIGIFVAILLISLPVTYFYLKHQGFLTQRHHLLCEVLRPGMSKEEVIKVLKGAGTISVSGAEDQSPDAQWYVVFTDPKGKNLYGGFYLGFWDNKYSSAYIRGFESFDVICDFLQPTGSVTVTP